MRKHGWFRPHVRGLTAISSTTLREGGGDIITSIFADGTDGFYFDFSKTDRLFQETTGVTAADDPGENIGLALEGHSWGGKTLAQEYAARPLIAGLPLNAAPWTTVGGIVVVGNTLTGANNGDAIKITGLTVGKTYKIEAATSAVSGAWRWIAEGTGTTYNTSISNCIFRATSTGLTLYCVIAGSVTVSSLTIKEVPGNHGLQATTAARPKWQTGGLARFDGLDDNLLTTLVPAATSLLFDVTVPATLAATQVICGGTVGTSRCLLAIDTSGRVCAGVGTDSTTTILGSSDLRGTRAKVGLAFDGSTVTLYQAGASVYSAAQNGSAGSDALRLGASNNAGTAGSFWAGDTYKGLAIKKALTAAEIAAITNKWDTT